jgi:agmatinase
MEELEGDYRNFLDLPPEKSGSDSRVWILPIPYCKASGEQGADRGPDAIIAASATIEFCDFETRRTLEGIYTCTPIPQKFLCTPEKMVSASKELVMRILGQKKLPVVLGGDHAVSIGPLYAVCAQYNDLSVVQLDAHGDNRNEYLVAGSDKLNKYSHACVMARVDEVCDSIFQVGIRSTDASEHELLKKHTVIGARRILAESFRGRMGWMNEVISVLKENVAITVDLDVFDPSIVPATGTIVPGGLDWFVATEFLRGVVKARNLVYLDVVELSPNERSLASDMVAAQLVYDVLINRTQ